MATSDTQIANEALIALGAKPVTDLYDSTDPNAVVLAEIFNSVRDELLMFHEWQFASVVVQLSEDEEVDNYTPYDYAYTLPTDLLRIVNIVDDETYVDLPYQPYIHRANRLFTDMSPCWIRYIARIEDVTEYPKWFDRALAMNLAYRAAFRIVENPQKLSFLQQEYGAAAAEALRMDAFAEREWTMPSDSIEDIG